MKYFYVQPRQSGKTNRLLYEYNKDPNNSIIICNNIKMAKYLCDLLKVKSCDNIKTQYLENENLELLRGKRILIDEYLSFDSKNQKRLYNKLKEQGIKELYIFSTSPKLYCKDLFNFVRDQKIFGHPRYQNLLKTELLEDYNDLYSNFITDNDVKLIFDGVSPAKSNTNFFTNKYQQEIAGELFINERIKEQINFDRIRSYLYKDKW